MKITDKEYAEYMLANNILGYIDIAAFMATVLFEKYFKNQVSKREARKEFTGKGDPSLLSYIDSYVKNKSRCDVFYAQTDDLATKLHNFRKLRNELIHHMSENIIFQKKPEIKELILYVYFSYHKNQNYDMTVINDIASNNILLQDYKIKEITERMIARAEAQKYGLNAIKMFNGIRINDFDNLFQLRKKLLYLQRNLEAEFTDTVGLVPTVLSPIDTTSAYIWMPFIDKDFTDNINNFKTQRNNLVIGSVSILATPLDFRIYIDFGGGDHEYRLAFQNFLQSEQFKKYILQYKNENPPLEIFDVKWYSFITKKNKLFDVVEQNKLDTMALDAIDIIEKEKRQGNIMTAGYNKTGFILPSRDIAKAELIKLFKKVAHIYYEFLIYKFKDDPDIDILHNAQKKLNLDQGNKKNNDDEWENFTKEDGCKKI